MHTLNIPISFFVFTNKYKLKNTLLHTQSILDSYIVAC